MTIPIPFKRNDWVFHAGQWFWPTVLWWTYPNIWTFWLWNVQSCWCIFHLDLRMSGYCISCLTWTSWKSGYDIHDLCCRHLWCWWSLVSEYCIRTRIIFHNVTSEWPFLCISDTAGSSSGFLRWQMTKMNFYALIPRFIDHFFLVSDFCQLPCLNFLQFFPILSPLLPLHLDFLNAWGIGMKLWTRL